MINKYNENSFKKLLLLFLVITLILSIIFLIYTFSVNKKEVHSWQSAMLMALCIDMILIIDF
jgi:uncharacterized membrane protein